tara:strand:+ start:70 stop:300 length:231 start_codon:yes stop_codon:yes gene_type:complete
VLVIGHIELNGNKGKAMRAKYVCKFCACDDKEKFTIGAFYECKKCRAARSKDINFLQYFSALQKQKLSNVYWKPRF